VDQDTEVPEPAFAKLELAVLQLKEHLIADYVPPYAIP
jgi:hypothetical protein